MTRAIVDDQLLGTVLRGNTPSVLEDRPLFTTGCWYVRLCQAVLGEPDRPGALSAPFANLSEPLRTRARRALLQLPEEIGLVSLRDLGPAIGTLRGRHALNILGMEALAAATHLDAGVYLSAPSRRLEAALTQEGATVTRWPA